MSSGSIECPHCLRHVHVNWRSTDIYVGPDQHFTGLYVSYTQCPSCSKAIVHFGHRREFRHLIYPLRRNRLAIDSESIPKILKDDYLEACDVLEISPKASAVLSRRVLQDILRKQGYDFRNLYDQINAVLEEKAERALPTSLAETIDLVRRFGNFSAHPSKRRITDETTLQVIDIEPGEAEWCLQIIEELFTYYYVEPDKRKKRIEAAEAKFEKLKKPASAN